jgi:methylmalonyl-CoA mutase
LNSPEDIQVKAFYKDELANLFLLLQKATEFSICQNIFVFDINQ